MESQNKVMIKSKTREYYEKLYTSKFENINKMDKFLKG